MHQKATCVETFIILGLSSLLGGGTRENMEKMRPLQVLYGIAVKNYKSVERLGKHSDLVVLQ